MRPKRAAVAVAVAVATVLVVGVRVRDREAVVELRSACDLVDQAIVERVLDATVYEMELAASIGQAIVAGDGDEVPMSERRICRLWTDHRVGAISVWWPEPWCAPASAYQDDKARAHPAAAHLEVRGVGSAAWTNGTHLYVLSGTWGGYFSVGFQRPASTTGEGVELLEKLGRRITARLAAARRSVSVPARRPTAGCAVGW